MGGTTQVSGQRQRADRASGTDAPPEVIAFYHREWPRLVGALTNYVGDRCVAEELAQEALIRAMASWSRVSALQSPGGWTHRVAMNLATSHLRRRLIERRARERQTEFDRAHDHDPSGPLDVRDALRKLPRKQQQAVALRYFADLPADEVATIMNTTPGYIRILTTRAFATLREDLQDLAHAAAPVPAPTRFDQAVESATAKRRRRTAVAAVVGLVLLVLGGLTVPRLLDGRDAPPVVDQPPTDDNAPPADGAAPEVTWSVPDSPALFAETPGAVWVGGREELERGDFQPIVVRRLDPATGEVLATIHVAEADGHNLCDLVPDGQGGLLVVACDLGWGVEYSSARGSTSRDLVARIDATTDEVSVVASGTLLARAVAVAEDGTIWAVNDTGLTAATAGLPILHRIDPATGAATAVDIGQGSTQAVISAFGSIWVSVLHRPEAGGTMDAGSLVRLDPASGEVLARIAISDPAQQLAQSEFSDRWGHRGVWSFAVAGGALWASVTDEGRVVRIDPSSNEVTASVPAGGAMNRVGAPLLTAWGDDRLVAVTSEPVAAVIDAASATIERTITVPRAMLPDAQVAGNQLLLPYPNQDLVRVLDLTDTSG